jgi:hypothetical protein
VGLVLGVGMLVLVPATLLIFREKVQALVEALEALQ